MKTAQSASSLPLFSHLDTPRKASAIYHNSPASVTESAWSDLDAENSHGENSQLAIYAAFALGGVVPALFLIL